MRASIVLPNALLCKCEGISLVKGPRQWAMQHHALISWLARRDSCSSGRGERTAVCALPAASLLEDTHAPKALYSNIAILTSI